MKTWKIYKHTLLADCDEKGFSYIGLTKHKNPNHRWLNGRGYNTQPIFWEAVQKYGWENFSHEIIEDNIDNLEKANEREQHWIAFYHTYINDPNCQGYNTTPGGGATDNDIVKIIKGNVSKYIDKADLEKYLTEGWRRRELKETREEYRQQHKIELKQKHKEYHKKYYQEHKQQEKQRTTDYQNKHKAKIKKYLKKYLKNYYQKNKDKIKEDCKNYYQEHKADIALRAKLYREKNKDLINAKQRARRKKEKQEKELLINDTYRGN